jgi:hypothetical protein
LSERERVHNGLHRESIAAQKQQQEDEHSYKRLYRGDGE